MKADHDEVHCALYEEEVDVVPMTAIPTTPVQMSDPIIVTTETR